MLDWLFESKHRRARDREEIRSLQARYGEDAKSVAKTRAEDAELSIRDRRHWQRIANKIRRTGA